MAENSQLTVVTGRSFDKAAKSLHKKYTSLADDLEALETRLIKEPNMGSPLGRDCYKVRMAITAKGRGKSGGDRVITCFKVLADKIVLLTIYDKADREDLIPKELERLLLAEGL